MSENKFEIIIIGGSYAGLSAAMALGRSMRSVLIIDSGSPCNRQTPHSHNFITQDGEKPQDITAKAKKQVLAYPTVQFVHDFAVSGKKTGTGFEISTESGKLFSAIKLIFATGIKDIMPDIQGIEACWGISVVHCPYCHGYEFRGMKTGIMANGERAFHIATLVNNLTNDLTIFTSGKADFSADQMQKLNTHKIRVIETAISEVEHDEGRVRSITFSDGDRKVIDALYVALPFTQHSDIPLSLGCEFTDTGYIKIDGMQKTTVDGVYACGDNSVMMRSVANAVYAGNLTGAVVNRELSMEQF